MVEWTRRARSCLWHRQAAGVYRTENAIAVIPYIGSAEAASSSQPNAQKQIRITALIATVASLIQHGVGRIVVVGHHSEADVKQAFRILLRHGTFRAELAYIHVDEATVKSKHETVNVPHGALGELQRALRGNNMNDAEQKQWLGSNRKWRYVYFTEDDHVLQARGSIATAAHKLMDEGGIIVPHRLQPIMHPLDLGGIVDQTLVLPDKFWHVHDLDTDSGTCCDAGATMQHPHCGSFWWLCGFTSGQNHSRLESYEFFRLLQGTGVVSIAGTAHGRKCLPTLNKRNCTVASATN